jgi:hypothetical protein
MKLKNVCKILGHSLHCIAKEISRLKEMPNLVLTANIPNSEADVLVFNLQATAQFKSGIQHD